MATPTQSAPQPNRSTDHGHSKSGSVVDDVLGGRTFPGGMARFVCLSLRATRRLASVLRCKFSSSSERSRFQPFDHLVKRRDQVAKMQASMQLPSTRSVRMINRRQCVSVRCSVAPQGAPLRSAAIRSPLAPAIQPEETRQIVCSASESAVAVPLAGGGNNNGMGGGNDDNGNGGNGGNGGSSGAPGGGSLDPAIAALLAAAGRTVESFPADFASALLAGKVTPEILKRFLELEANFFVKMVWGMQGFRERLLGDPSFPVKVGIECGIGVVTKVTAEKTKRGDSFWPEIDFVGANVVMAIIADFMLTWIPAPTLSYMPRKKSTSALMNFFASCPDNAFQRVPSGMEPFSMGQRLGAIIRNGGKLLGVGFCASMLGVGITNVLVLARQMMDPGWAPPNKPQDVLQTSAAYGVYMSVSSNLRYQMIAGIVEERGIETIFKGNHQLCHILSFIVRTGNTFVGSLLWVDFVRLCGMQKASAPKAIEAEPVVEAKAGKKKGKQ